MVGIAVPLFLIVVTGILSSVEAEAEASVKTDRFSAAASLVGDAKRLSGRICSKLHSWVYAYKHWSAAKKRRCIHWYMMCSTRVRLLIPFGKIRVTIYIVLLIIAAIDVVRQISSFPVRRFSQFLPTIKLCSRKENLSYLLEKLRFKLFFP